MIYNSIFILLLILLNAFFVAVEYSLLTIRKTQIDQLVKHKAPGYVSVKKAVDNMHMIVLVTQLGNTLCSLLLGLFGEPFVEGFLFPLIRMIPIPAFTYASKSISIIITISLLAFLQMIFGEIIPKAIALNRPETAARVLVLPLNIFIFFFSPFIIITHKISALFLGMMRIPFISRNDADYNGEEIKAILTSSMKHHVLPNHQVHLLSNMLALHRTPVTKLMINKNRLICFSHNETLKEIKNKIIEKKLYYNRYPIYFSKKVIIGFIHITDILHSSNNGSQNMKLNETKFIREILYITDGHPADKLLIQMKERGIHAAVVMSQAHNILGIITLTDIVRFLVHNRG